MNLFKQHQVWDSVFNLRQRPVEPADLVVREVSYGRSDGYGHVTIRVELLDCWQDELGIAPNRRDVYRSGQVGVRVPSRREEVKVGPAYLRRKRAEVAAIIGVLPTSVEADKGLDEEFYGRLLSEFAGRMHPLVVAAVMSKATELVDALVRQQNDESRRALLSFFKQPDAFGDDTHDPALDDARSKVASQREAFEAARANYREAQVALHEVSKRMLARMLSEHADAIADGVVDIPTLMEAEMMFNPFRS